MKNPHNIPIDKIVLFTSALRSGRYWDDFPLKVNIGPSTRLQATDGRPFIRIAELYAPDKCTYECHPNNFSNICDIAKRILLGEFTERHGERRKQPRGRR